MRVQYCRIKKHWFHFHKIAALQFGDPQRMYYVRHPQPEEKETSLGSMWIVYLAQTHVARYIHPGNIILLEKFAEIQLDKS